MVTNSLSVTGVGVTGALTVTNQTVGNSVRLLFGAIPSNTQAVVTITSFVKNIPATVAGTVITNSASYSYAGTPGGSQYAAQQSNTVSLTVIEPKLGMAKAISPNKASANEPVTMTLVVTNTGTATAYDVVVDDPLPTAYYMNTVEGTTPAGFGFSTVSAPPNSVVRYTGGDINAGQTITFTFKTTLTTSVIPGNVLTNVATVTQYTTMPGVNPNERSEPPVQSAGAAHSDGSRYRRLQDGWLDHCRTWPDTNLHGLGEQHRNGRCHRRDRHGDGAGQHALQRPGQPAHTLELR